MKNKAVIPGKKLHHPDKACKIQTFEPVEVLHFNEPKWWNTGWFGVEYKQTATVKSLLQGDIFTVFIETIQYVDEYPEAIEISYEK